MARRARKSSVPGARLLRDVAKRLNDGWPCGLTLLTGEDLYHLDMAQRLLLDHLVPEDEREFGLTVYGDEKVPLGNVIGAVRSAGMFAEKRVVLVRHLEALDGEPDALVEFAKAPPPTSFLIVHAPSLDLRRKLHKALASSGTTLDFGAMGDDPREWAETLGRMAKEKGVTLHRDAAMFLADICGGDLYRVDSELEKLALWLGDLRAETATEADVRESAAGSGLLSGWEVADALLARDRGGALAAARKLVEDGDEPIRIVGGLAYRARSMLTAKAMMEAGAPPQEVIRAANAWMYKDALLRGLKHYTLQEILRFPGLLMRADRTLKSRSIDSRAVLEDLVDRMTARPAAPGR